MAESGAPSWSTPQILCRYYVHGACRAGDNCPYSHDLSRGKPVTICKFYVQGRCTYGANCRYDHVRPERMVQPTPAFYPPGSPANPLPSPQPAPQMVAPVPVPPPGAATTPVGSKMVTLRKGVTPQTSPASDSTVSPVLKSPDQWAKAAEFVPGQLWKGSNLPPSYLAAAQTGVDTLSLSDPAPELEECGAGAKGEMCPFAAMGECPYGDSCTYIHGDRCDLCGHAVLHPTDNKQRQQHHQDCVKQHELDMELSFAIAQSKDKTCGICMEVVFDKTAAERRFGILSNCNHIFCLSCIRKWRAAKTFENKIVRACPECRVKSDFVTPSKYWVENTDEKQALIEGYKIALSKKPCKYFKKGDGECPFNANCFYAHSYPDGRKASPRPIRRRRREDGNGEMELISQIFLWDFLEERNQLGLSLMFDWDDLDLDDYFVHLNFWDSSSDDSDSEFEGGVL